MKRNKQILGAALASVLALLASTSANSACVRGPAKNLTLQGELAIDRQAGLIWLRCAVGRKWDERRQICIGHPSGLSQNDAKTAAQHAGPGWHVPTGEELNTLRVNSCRGAKIDNNAFPNVELSNFGEGANFWTSTAALPGAFYYFNFTDGTVDFHSAGFQLSVFLVRSGQKSK